MTKPIPNWRYMEAQGDEWPLGTKVRTSLPDIVGATGEVIAYHQEACAPLNRYDVWYHVAFADHAGPWIVHPDWLEVIE